MPLLSNRNMNGARRFRELLSSSDVIQAPGAYDCLTARLIEAAGFPIVYMTGFGIVSGRRPDTDISSAARTANGKLRKERRVSGLQLVDFSEELL